MYSFYVLFIASLPDGYVHENEFGLILVKSPLSEYTYAKTA